MGCFFDHKYELIDVQESDFYAADVDNIEDTIPIREETLILYKCSKCGHLKTKRISGHWKLDQIKGK